MRLYKRSASLRVIHGPDQGKRFDLDHSPMILGSQQCDIVLAGAYLSRRHAELTQNKQGDWTLSSLSVNDTRVNQAKIDSRVLENGDILQLGTETRLQFDANKKTQAKDRQKQKPKSTSAWKMTRRTLVIAGISVYLVAFLMAIIFLSNWESEKKQAELSQAAVQQALKDTEKQLLSSAGAGCGTVGMVISETIPIHADNLYYRLLQLKDSGKNKAQVKAVAEDLMNKIRNNWFQVWRLEGQGQWQDAMTHYRVLAGQMPDIRCPSTRMAMARLDDIEKKLAKKK